MNQSHTLSDKPGPKPNQPSRISRYSGWGLLAIVLVISFVWRVSYLAENAFDYDEGHWLMFGVLAAEGFEPYVEIFVGIPPLALLTIQAGVLLFGTTWQVRIPMMLYSLVGVVAIFWLVKNRPGGQPVLAGLLAAVFLSFGPRYFPHSVSIMAEIPAVAMALLSMVLAWQYQPSGRYYWLFLSGSAFALSLSLKLFVVFLPAIIGIRFLIIAWPLGRSGTFYRTLVKMAVVWGGGVLITVGCFFLLYDPAEMYQQVIGFRLSLREVPLFSPEHLEDVRMAWKEEEDHYWPLVMLSLLYFPMTKPRRWLEAWPWFAWFGLAALFSFTHDPLRRRHLVVLLPALAALSAIGMSALLTYLYRGLREPLGKYQAVITGGLLVWLLFLPLKHIGGFSREDFNLERRPDLRAITQTIEGITARDDYIVVDDQRFAIYTERLVPPFLSETSLARIWIGWITPEDIVREAKDYHAPLVMVKDHRFELIPGVYEAVEGGYGVRILFYDEDEEKPITIYLIQTDATKEPAHPVDASLGGQVLLRGADLWPASWRAGGEVSISTYWQAQTSLTRDYKIFLHLLNQQGELVAQFDHYPFQIELSQTVIDIQLNPQYQAAHPLETLTNYPQQGLIPTRVWMPEQTLRDTITTRLPDTLPEGAYQLYVGLYDEETGERLPVDGSNGGQTAILLGQVEVDND